MDEGLVFAAGDEDPEDDDHGDDGEGDKPGGEALEGSEDGALVDGGGEAKDFGDDDRGGVEFSGVSAGGLAGHEAGRNAVGGRPML